MDVAVPQEGEEEEGGDETATRAVPLVSGNDHPTPSIPSMLRRPEDGEANTALAISEAPLQKRRVASGSSNPTRSMIYLSIHPVIRLWSHHDHHRAEQNPSTDRKNR